MCPGITNSHININALWKTQYIINLWIYRVCFTFILWKCKFIVFESVTLIVVIFKWSPVRWPFYKTSCEWNFSRDSASVIIIIIFLTGISSPLCLISAVRVSERAACWVWFCRPSTRWGTCRSPSQSTNQPSRRALYDRRETRRFQDPRMPCLTRQEERRH